MEDNILIDSNLDMNEQNIKSIILKLSDRYSNQEYFIQIIKDSLKQAKLGNKDAFLKLEKISCILPKVIENIGLPFADLINNNNEILNYYIDNCIQNKNLEISKSIIINFIEIFNFKLTGTNPIDALKSRLKKANIDIKNIPKEKRQSKKLIETIYDELEELYNTWKTIFNMEKSVELEEHYSDILNASLKEKNEKIKKFENQNLYSKATIVFLKEKLKKIEDFISLGEVQKIGKPKNKINTPQNIINNNKPKLNEKENENNIINDNNKNWLTKEEKQKLREIELKNRTFFYENEYLVYGEDQSIEFKNYFYPLETEQEKEIKRQYIGFLNSKGGRIYIGINDQKIVRGIILTYKNCDNYRNYLVGLSNDFYPKCRLDKIKVYFIPIKNSFNGKFINNLYVVKIIILPGDPYSLYSITKKGGFISAIRRQSQVFNLDAEDITIQILERNNLKRKQENQITVPDLYLSFNDPEPEKNLEESKDDLKSLEEKSDKSSSNSNKNKKRKKGQKVIYVVNVRNIDKTLKVKEINKLFSGLQQSYQKFYAKKGNSLGYGKLHFNTEEAANIAIKKFNGNNLGGKRSVVMTLQKNKFFNRINK